MTEQTAALKIIIPRLLREMADKIDEPLNDSVEFLEAGFPISAYKTDEKSRVAIRVTIDIARKP